MKPLQPICRLRTAIAATFVATSISAQALDTATITASALSPDCLDYQVVGICYWLYCSPSGCRIRTSVKVRHYVPDAVVSSYQNTGENPWLDLALMSPPNSSAQTGGEGTANQTHQNNLEKFKNADAIGHPAGLAFNQFAAASGYTCPGAGDPFLPYLLSTLDTAAWRYNVPETVYPEALIPGMREVGSLFSLGQWGAVYPRGGFLHQSDDHKAAAVVAQRAGDVITRHFQPHVYQPLLASPKAGYWPAGALVETNASTGKWQELAPLPSLSCTVFPHAGLLTQDTRGAYAWALWRPYSCCKRRGQVFLGSTDIF